MESRQERVLLSFRRVQGWLAARPELAKEPGSAGTAPSALTQQEAALSVVIGQVGSAASQQDAKARAAAAATVETKRLRTELVTEHMRPIANMARAAIPDVARMTQALRMPGRQVRAEGLIAAAEAMATVAAQHAAELESRGLPADFISQLRATSLAYKQEIDARGQALVARKGATKAVDAALATGRKIVTTMSVIVTKALRRNPSALAEWTMAHRVTNKGVKGTGSPVAIPAPITPVTPTAPVAPGTPAAQTAPSQQKAA